MNGFGCVKVRTNSYSVPLAAGTDVHAKAYASRVELWHEGNCVAHHARCYGHQQQTLELEHYLDVLWRKRGRWPDRRLLSNNGRRVCGRPFLPEDPSLPCNDAVRRS